NELLADAAERASVVAHLLGGATYPKEQLRENWIRFLWHQFHDDLTGTSIPEAYEFSWNDEILSQKSFAAILENAVEAVAAGLDTRGEGIPLVVFNPLSIYRSDIVEATVVFESEPFGPISVFSSEGHEMPSQILIRSEDSATILFFAQAPPLGFAVYDIRSVNASRTMRDRVTVSDSTLENGRYRVGINDAGDVASIYDLGLERELLAQPVRLELLNDKPKNWPAWEIDYNDVMAAPRDYVRGSAEISILEKGPLRGAIQIKRRGGESEFTQIVRLAAPGAGSSRIEFNTHIRWREKETLLKAVFHLTSPSDSVTYDLGLGTIKRGLNKPKLYEVPGHEWADLTTEDGSFGVSILNDCKYGWDHPDAQTLRLTLIHTPGVGENWGWVGDQASQDIGNHQVKYALVAHRGDWRDGGIPGNAAAMNQPLLTFQATKHEGFLGKHYSLIYVGQPEAAEAIPAVAIKSVKLAEEGDEIIVRLQELFGRPSDKIMVRFAEPIISAREVNGAEEPLGDATIRDGALWTTFSPYQLRTFAVRLAPPDQQLVKPSSQPLTLPCNLDGISGDGNRNDDDFDGEGRSLAEELIPNTLMLEDIPFIFGSKAPGALNAVRCEGQTINLPNGKYDELHLLACSVDGQPSLAEFVLGKEKEKAWIDDFQQRAGQWNNRIISERMTQEAAEIAPSYISRFDIGWTGTHHHTAKGENAAYEFTYLYHINFDITKGAKTLKFPDNPAIRLMAATAVNRNRERIRAAQPLHDMTNATLAEIHATRLNFIDSTVVNMTSPIPGAIIHFTLDNAEPTDQAAIYEAPITIKASATIKARAFCQGMDEAYIASLTVQKRVPRDPIHIGGLSPGLTCRYYEGEWSQLPNFDSLDVIRESSLPMITIPDFARPEKFGLDFFG
ncbi:MAG TPA: glycoside hydrolase family 38 C-terminal domain-containing protein, partial [bacterium]